MENNNYQVAMLNRGRVVWVEKSQVAEQQAKGWIRIDNPKQDYYPQYDQPSAKMLEDDRVAATHIVDNEDYVDRLGLIEV